MFERRSSGFVSHNPRNANARKCVSQCLYDSRNVLNESITHSFITDASTKPIIPFMKCHHTRKCSKSSIKVYTGHNMLLQLSKNYFLLPPHDLPRKLFSARPGISCGCPVIERQDLQILLRYLVVHQYSLKCLLLHRSLIKAVLGSYSLPGGL